MLQVSPLGTAFSHQVPASLHDPNHTPGSARSHQVSSSHSDAHAPDAHWGPPKFPSATVTQTARWNTRPVPPSHANPAWRKRAWIAIRRHRASRQPHVAEVHVDSSVGEPLVKPVPIRAGLSERWWTQLVLKIWRLFPVRKRTPKNRGSLWHSSYGGKLSERKRYHATFPIISIVYVAYHWGNE